jgi:hypothetical protein
MLPAAAAVAEPPGKYYKDGSEYKYDNGKYSKYDTKYDSKYDGYKGDGYYKDGELTYPPGLVLFVMYRTIFLVQQMD